MNQEQIKIALESQPLTRFSYAEKLKEVERLIGFAYEMKGQQPLTRDKMDMAVATIEGKLSSEYSFLTIGELQIIFDAGLSGELSTSSVVNPANILQWIAVYSKCSDRADALRAALAKRNAGRNRFIDNLTTAEIARRNADDEANEPRRAFERYKNGGRKEFLLAGYTAHLYDALSRAGKMPTAKEVTLTTAKNRAREVMRASLGKNAFEAALKDQTSEEMYIKQELVFLYFDALIQTGRTL